MTIDIKTLAKGAEILGEWAARSAGFGSAPHAYVEREYGRIRVRFSISANGERYWCGFVVDDEMLMLTRGLSSQDVAEEFREKALMAFQGLAKRLLGPTRIDHELPSALETMPLRLLEVARLAEEGKIGDAYELCRDAIVELEEAADKGGHLKKGEARAPRTSTENGVRWPRGESVGSDRLPDHFRGEGWALADARLERIRELEERLVQLEYWDAVDRDPERARQVQELVSAGLMTRAGAMEMLRLPAAMRPRIK